MALQKSNDTLSSGDLDRPLRFFAPADAQDTDGGVLRPPQLAYKAMGAVQPLNKANNELEAAGRELYSRWAIITIQYVPSRIPVEGMTVLDVRSGETYEVRGAVHVNSSTKKIEIVANLVR